MTASIDRADRALIDAVRAGLAGVADPTKAPAMQAYMKSSMPYYGVPAPSYRRICRAIFTRHPLPDADSWRATVLALWREAAYREERYAAVELTGVRRYWAYQTLAALPMYE